VGRLRVVRARLGMIVLGTTAAVCAVGGALLVEQASTLGRVAFALGVVGINLTVGGVVVRANRRVASRVRRVEDMLRENHKRASHWDWRVRQEVAALRKRLDPPRPAAPAPFDWKKHPDARLLLDSGVFDPDLYAAMIDARFNRDLDAAGHYLTFGMKNLEPPCVLIEPGKLPEPVQAAMRAGKLQPLLQHLRTPAGVTQPLSPCFFPTELALPAGSLQRHPGGAVGYFMSMASAEARLPIPADAMNHGCSLAEARTEAIALARSFHEWRRRTGPRTTAQWDALAEHDWIAQTRAECPASEAMVSVIMPVRDRIGTVGAAVTSVLRQTHQNWELIVVDDGSVDGTLDLVREFAARDARIRVISNAASGVSAARNAGLAQSSGDFVAFLDSDNQWLPHFLELMVRVMALHGHDAAYACSVSRNEDGKETYRAFNGGLEHLLLLNHIDLNVLMVRGAIARRTGFDEHLRRWVDHDFVLRVARQAQPAFLPFIGCEYDDSPSAADRITVRESDHWQWVALGKNWADVSGARGAAAHPGRISVVIPTYNDATMTLGAVRSVLEDPSWDDIEVLVVDNGSNLTVGREIAIATAGCARVKHLRLPRNYNFAIGCNYGAVQSSGEYIFFLNNDTTVRPGTLSKLVARLAGDPAVRGVQPLLVYPDDTVQTAGTVFLADDAPPVHLLVGHPQEDARGVDDVEFSAVTAAALLVRRDEFLELGGFDPIFVNGMEDVDYCLRACAARPGAFRVVSDARVTHFESKTPGRGKNIGENRRLFRERWAGKLPKPEDRTLRRLGFEVAHLGSDFSPVPAPRPVLARCDRSRLRWAIKIASVPGARGDLWGDTHFAESLAAGLRIAGHDVVTYRHGAHQVPATAFDDVVVCIRGLDRVAPMPGKTNVLWVISHPEMVTIEEMAGFDLVLAASSHWAAKMTQELGRPVHPFLQATDSRLFGPVGPRERIPGAVFVGGSYRGRGRRVVKDALEAGIPLTVFGPDWDGLIPAHVYGGKYVDNKVLARVYRGADFVLADHWSDMAREGFIQNRLFDAVAAGARVISDPVDGIEELFDGAVQVYGSPEELAALCTQTSGVRFPKVARRREIAERIRGEHSFEARARELARLVASVRM